MAKQATVPLSRCTRSIERALLLHRQGRLGRAERIYNAVLAADPQHFAALHLSAILKHQQGRSAEALRLVCAALNAQPGSTDALASYGVILEALNRHDEALAAFDRALEMGAGGPAVHFNRANVLDIVGRYADALAGYDTVLALAPGHVDALYNRGNTLVALDRCDEAVASFDRALSMAPERADVHANRGAALMELDRIDEALESLDRAVAVDPNNVAALNTRGNALTRLKRYDEALASYDRALALSPGHVHALSNRGLALFELGRCDEALDHYTQALRVAPGFVPAHLKRGNTLVKLKRMEEALASYTRAIALAPNNREANFNAAITRLCLGDFCEGWKQYEYRWDRKKYAPRPNFPRPIWRGEMDVRGKTILLTAEQGLGDAIQFVRYAPLVAALGAKVLLGVHRPLTALMATVPGISQVVGPDETLPDFDLYCPLLSLPLAFATDLATIPATVPYLRPHEGRLAKWRGRLAESGRLRVGICWAGSAAHANDCNRSIPLDRFATILSVSDVDFVSLRKEVSDLETAILRRHDVLQLGEEFGDFADTAAVVAQLDLVISADTSVAHLAGAMAKAVGLLVPFSPDWRWLLERTDSPWYPTMRLFRQTAIGDWDGPLARVRAELAALADLRSRRAVHSNSAEAG